MAYKFQLGAFTASGSIKAEEGFDANEQNITNVGSINVDTLAADGTEIDIALANNQAAALEIKEGSNVYQKFVTSTGSEAIEFMKPTDFGNQASANMNIDTGDIASAVVINKSPEVTLAGDLGGSATFTNLGDATLTAPIQAGSVEHGMLADDIISGQAELAHADIDDADDMMISDGGVIKKVGVDSLRDHFFGVVSGDVLIADGGAATIQANAVEDSMLNDNVATGLAGDGLAAASGVLSVGVDDSTIELDSDAVRVKAAGITEAHLNASVAGAGLSGGGGSALAVEVSGALKVASDKVAISGSIAELNGGLAFSGGADSNSGLKMLPSNTPNIANASLIAANDLFLLGDQSDSFAAKNITLAKFAEKLAGDGLSQDADGIIDAEVDDSSIEIDSGSNALQVKALGVTNGMLAGSIANSKLVNDSVTLTQGAGMAALGAVALGSSITVGVDGVLEDLDTLGAASADGEFIVATGAGAFAYESGNTARTSLGLGTGDSPQFTSLTLSGDLTVNGAMTTISTTNLDVEDNLILLGSGSQGAGHANDMGLVFRTGNDQKDHGFIYDQSLARFAMIKEAADSDLMDATATGNLTIDAYADLQVNKLIADSIEAVIVESVQTVNSTGALSLSSGTIVKCDSQSGDITITLPSSVGNSGKIVKFKKISAANNVVLDADGSETIDGEALITLESPFAAVSLISDGANWFVM